MYLWKSIGMCSDDGHVSRLRARIVEWDILLHRQVERLFLRRRCRLWIFSDVLCRDDMFYDPKGPAGGGHDL
jgi:hypothetical protein